MLHTLAVSGYRSLRTLVLPLGPLTVVSGPNGSGKSSLYRAIRLIAEAAQGRVVSTLAAEGGLQSTLWAGPADITRSMKRGEEDIVGQRRSKPIQLRLGFSGDDYGYAIDLGMPVPDRMSLFNKDPEIKSEAVWVGEVLRRNNVIAERSGPVVKALDKNGARQVLLHSLSGFDSMMTHGADPVNAPELLLLRDRMRAWRFYDHFRTDQSSPARGRVVGTRTPALAADGSDLASAVQTIFEVGDNVGLEAAVDDAFPGSRIEIEVSEPSGLFELVMHQHGLLRPLRMSELSDGTLRYLLLLAALKTPRPPSLLVLNEPEASLHPDLLLPLSRLIGQAAKNAQIIVVSHAEHLVTALEEQEGCVSIRVEKELGETIAPDCEAPPWAWPSR